VDLRLYFRVLWRFRFIVAIGFVLAGFLAFFSVARISFHGGSPRVSYRQPETWKATVLVFLTQKGFPYGYTVLPYNPAQLPATGSTLAQVPRYADVGRFTELAVYYAPFVQSDEFRAMLRQQTHIKGLVQAQPVLDPAHQMPLPYIDLFALAPTPAAAVTLANKGSNVFQRYLVGQQNANGIPPSKRVEAQVISRAQRPVIFAGRKKTTPIAIFLTVLLAAIGLCFVLENLRPRVHKVEAIEDSERTIAARRPA
jgi:hypothetical protein